MLQPSLETEALHYLQPSSVLRSSLKNDLCRSPMGSGAKVIAMQVSVISSARATC